jgi:hypothetical protein
VLARDSTLVPTLQPGLPEKLAFCWEQAAGAALPAVLDVRLPHYTYRHSAIDGELTWWPDDPKLPAAWVRAVPVLDRRTAA